MFERFSSFIAPSSPAWGLALCAAIAALAQWAAALPWLAERGIGPLTVAIALGLLLGNAAPSLTQGRSSAGLAWAKRPILRAGIVLYGLRITLQELGQIGWVGLALDVAVVASTFVLARWLGVRWLGLAPAQAMLIGAGSAVCGAAAVLATAPVVRARGEQVAVAVATVVVFGTLAMVLYPIVFHYGASMAWALVPSAPEQFGLYLGATVHEVAQVVAAAAAISPEAAAAAIVAKMLRVMLLAPLLLTLAWWMLREDGEQSQQKRTHASTWRQMQSNGVIPWFALGFVAMVGLNSTGWLPQAAVAAGVMLDGWLLAVAMAALGLSTQAAAIGAAGWRPMLLAAVLMGWLMGGGLAMLAILN